MISGTTEIVVIVGEPIRQVKSPQNFNHWFESRSQDTAMIAMDLASECAEAFTSVARGWRNLRGVVVTVPHKQAFAKLCDALTPRAEALGAANVVRRDADGTLTGDMVDGFGFLGAARAHGFSSPGRRALIIGAGGVGSAIAFALCEAGIAQLRLMDVNADRLKALSTMLQGHFPNVEIMSNCDSLATLDLVVNATPIGMATTSNSTSAADLPLPRSLLDTLPASALVADVVTSPDITPLLATAEAKGCRIQRGAEMAKAQLEFLGGFMGVMPAVDPEALLQAAAGSANS
ncbi:shikimate dehydrogenase family protein [Variovorax beijingensis]|uniref:shikimate dehydrogenase family protein n=1 Tax=Variovorax beijingensis TaxID=2496117 RepID=UPI003F69A934